MMVFYSNIELNQNEIQDAILHPVANEAAVASPLAGQVIFDQSTSLLKYYDGTAWVTGEDTTYTATAPIQISGTNVVTIDPAVGGTSAGSISAADQQKLDNATNANIVNTLVERDASGNFESVAPTADLHVANKKYVDDAITELGEYVGGWDASAGLPTAGSGGAGEIDAGDYWDATVAGTIAGLTPITTIEVGDVLKATVDGASAAADFIVMQRNMDIDDTAYVKEYQETDTYSSGVTKTITHNLNNANPVITIYRVSDGRVVNGRVITTGLNTVTIRLTGGGFPRDFTVTVHAA